MADIKKLQRISCIEDVEKGYELIKEKHPEELEYLNQFKESHWKEFRKHWLSTCLNSGLPQTNNACERHIRYFE